MYDCGATDASLVVVRLRFVYVCGANFAPLEVKLGSGAITSPLVVRYDFGATAVPLFGAAFGATDVVQLLFCCDCCTSCGGEAMVRHCLWYV